MIVHFLKFIHILLTLTLLGTAGFCLILIGTRKLTGVPGSRSDLLFRLNKAMLHTALLAMLTGTLLVYPKHFTFHTPWIQAAYLLVGFFCFVMVLLLIFKQKRNLKFLGVLYAVMFVLLVGVVHDAVTKTSFLF